MTTAPDLNPSQNIPPDSTPDPAPTPRTLPPVEEMSLAAALGRLLTRPASTFSAIGAAADRINADRADVAARRSGSGRTMQDAEPRAPRPRPAKPVTSRRIFAPEILGDDDYIRVPRAQPLSLAYDGPAVNIKLLPPLLFMIGLWLIGIIGGALMLASGRNRTQNDLTPGIYLLVASGIGFAVVVSQIYSTLRLPRLEDKSKNQEKTGIGAWIAHNAMRLILAGISFLLMLGAYTFNDRNLFTELGVACWLLSVVGFVLTFMPEGMGLGILQQTGRFALSLPNRAIAFRITPTFVILIGILLLGAYFRFSSLEAYPPDMTSDHVEKALDTQLISEGYRPVFLPNNGGREVAHFYFLALLKTVTGMPADFNLLKIASGIEGVLGILAAFWLGRVFFKEEDKDLGNLVGLIMAGMLAVSYWEIMLSRLGLRIVLTPLVITLLIGYFARALRYNRRWDWILSGVILGVGVYCYQAVRMVPVFILIGFALALLLRVRRWADLRAYLFNFFVLVVIAVALFAPMGRFMVDRPAEFWSRTTGRLFGEDTIEIKDPQTGAVVSRMANPQDRMDAFRSNIGYFWSNMQKSVFMFNWYGDPAWVTGSSDANPQLDRYTGALLLLGLGAWVIRMIKRRDPADWLFPFALLVMLFPTALSLAFVIEVPSATRASGSIPFVYLMAAFAAALIFRQAWRVMRAPILRVGVFIVAVIVLALMANQNANSYFTVAMAEYRNSTLPHAQAGKILRGFEDSTGAAGNAFMIAYPYWWDHRALAIEAGDIKWNNGVLQDDLKNRISGFIQGNAGTRYAFQPDKQVLFFLNAADTASLDILKAWIPDLSVQRIKAFNEGRDFLIAIAPAVGCEWYAQNFAGLPIPLACQPRGVIP